MNTKKKTSGDRIRFVLETITPHRAGKLLESMVTNRTPKARRVAAMARDMKNGRYEITHQSMAVDRNGHLIDGNHRVLACIEAGVPFKTYVAYNVPESARLNTDDNVPRSFNDACFMSSGIKMSTNEAGVIRSMKRGFRAESVGNHSSKSELLDFTNIHSNALTFAWEAIRGQRFISRGPIAAVIARAFYTVDHGQLKEFADKLKTGMPSAKRDVTIIRLRDALRGRDGKRTEDSMAYRKTSAALRAWLDGRALTRLIESKAELFHIPGEAHGESGESN